MANKAKKKKEISIRIGNTIKGLRKKQKMPLIELAEKSSIQIATLSRIEHNKMTGTIETHAQIARALGIELYTLYKDIQILPKQNDKIQYSGLG